MSGHSKWSTIKRKKGALDAKRGQLFTKLGRAISISAREGGGDPETNFSLRLAIDKAKRANMPVQNIERAVKRGTGELEGEGVLEKDVYGGYGPGGVALAVDVLTDNRNRTLSEVRKIFENHGGNLADASSVLWQFKEKGLVVVKCAKVEEAEKFGEDDKEVPVDHETVMMEMMDIESVIDVGECDDTDETGARFCEVLTEVKELAVVHQDVEKRGYIVVSSEIIKIPDQSQEVDEAVREKIETLTDLLESHDDVENVWNTLETAD